MNDPILDHAGQTVFTGIAENTRDGYTGVCVGFRDPDDGRPVPVLLLDPGMARALAGDIVATAKDIAEGSDTTGHTHAVLTGRLLLASITDNFDAFSLILDDVVPCLGCWQRIATQLLGVATEEIVENRGRDGAISMAEDFIADMLDADETGRTNR